MIDLHCHSHFSDGLHSPELLVEKALCRGLRLLALTDHDTLAGIDDLTAAASGTSLQSISGIELSVCWKKQDIHILGLGFTDRELISGLVDLQMQSRIERGKAIGQALEDLGFADAYQLACTKAGHNRVGRLHFAQVLQDLQAVKDLQAAFRRYLGRGKPAYQPSNWISLEEAVAGIVSAKGMAVIAHPLKYGLTRTKLHELISQFKEAGGQGIEVISGEMTSLQIHEMTGLCKRFKLLASSGSDYHGEGISRLGLGQQASLPEGCQPVWEQWL